MTKGDSSSDWVYLFVREMQVLNRHDRLGSECFVDFIEIDVVFGDTGFGEDCWDCECWSDTGC